MAVGDDGQGKQRIDGFVFCWHYLHESPLLMMLPPVSWSSLVNLGSGRVAAVGFGRCCCDVGSDAARGEVGDASQRGEASDQRGALEKPPARTSSELGDVLV
jgi:hypothetical protein